LVAKNKARERKKQVAKRERKFKEFIKLIRDGFECWMMSRKYGIRAKVRPTIIHHFCVYFSKISFCVLVCDRECLIATKNL